METDKVSVVEKAKKLAKWKHEGQKDKYGNPYSEHLERVATRVRDMEYDFVDDTSDIELYVAAAYLHDLLEDTDSVLEDLDEFGPEISTAVYLLTRQHGIKYTDYIDQIVFSDTASAVGGKIARLVKLADLLDHLQGPTPCPPELVKRYEKSLYRLITKAGF